MKLEVYGSEKPIDKIVRLKLEQVEGDVTVIAVNEFGSRLPSGDLVTFKTDGRIHRCHAVNPSFGFNLNGAGAITEKDE